MRTMRREVSAICANCDSRVRLDVHGRCEKCGSDAVTYALFSRWLSTGKLKEGKNEQV